MLNLRSAGPFFPSITRGIWVCILCLASAGAFPETGNRHIQLCTAASAPAGNICPVLADELDESPFKALWIDAGFYTMERFDQACLWIAPELKKASNRECEARDSNGQETLTAEILGWAIALSECPAYSGVAAPSGWADPPASFEDGEREAHDACVHRMRMAIAVATSYSTMLDEMIAKLNQRNRQYDTDMQDVIGKWIDSNNAYSEQIEIRDGIIRDLLDGREERARVASQRMLSGSALMALGSAIANGSYSGGVPPASSRSGGSTYAPTVRETLTVDASQTCPLRTFRLIRQEVRRGNRMCYYGQ